MPMLKRVHTREDLPKLIKGRGIPVGGPNPRTMLTFRRAWKKMARVIPAAVI
jgi:hypothetical protein